MLNLKQIEIAELLSAALFYSAMLIMLAVFAAFSYLSTSYVLFVEKENADLREAIILKRETPKWKGLFE